jgi:hypothetical protein
MKRYCNSVIFIVLSLKYPKGFYRYIYLIVYKYFNMYTHLLEITKIYVLVTTCPCDSAISRYSTTKTRYWNITVPRESSTLDSKSAT